MIASTSRVQGSGEHMRVPAAGFLSIAVSLAIGLAMTPICAAEADPLDQVLAQASQHATAQADFTQVTTHSDGDTREVLTTYSGRLYLRKPAAYDLTYTDPNDAEWMLRLICDGKTTWKVERMFSDQDPDVSTRPVSGDDDFGRRLADLLNFDRAAIERDFALTSTANDNGVQVNLVPHDPDLAARLASLTVDLDADGKVTAVVLDEPTGNRITITVTLLTFEPEIPPGVFTWGAP
jgi:outer membrane lipoprotein-sorting protein